jgi:acetolactate synthase-1/2/3 large subunit
MRAPVDIESTNVAAGTGLENPGYPAIQPDPDAIEAAAGLLKDARNPMIMVGGGAQDAAREVLELAEMLQAPVVPHRGGRGVVSDDHYLGFTVASGYKRRSQTDVVIGIGTRLELLWFRWDARPWGASLITIDIDPLHVTRFSPDVGIVGDVATATAALVEAVRRGGCSRPSRAEEFEAVKEQTRREIQKVQPYMDFLRAIREVLPRDGIFVDDVCQAGFAAIYGFPVYQPRTYITCGPEGTLGYGFPTALGVKVARPDRAVVSIAGDGGFQFGLQELATAAQYRIGLVMVVFDNQAYGNVRWDQRRMFDGRVIGAELVNPDFVALAESFGVAGRRVATPAELRDAVEQALENGAPALIHVPIERGSEVSPWEFMNPAYAKG